MAKMFGINEFLPDTKFTTFIGRVICNEHSMTSGICTNVLFLIAGFDYKQLNQVTIFVCLSICKGKVYFLTFILKYTKIDKNIEKKTQNIFIKKP